MPTGYIASSIAGADFDHACQWKAFFAEGSWWAAGDDGSASDFFLYQWDGTFPASDGDTGGWAKALGPGGSGSVNLDTRDSATLALWYDAADSSLHTLGCHSTAQYTKWMYQSGTDSWTTSGGVATENVGLSLASNNGVLAVDSNGVVWVGYYSGTSYLSRYRSGGSWSAGPTIDTSEASVGRVIALGTWVDDDGDPCICAAVQIVESGVDTIKFCYRKDSAALSAAWTVEDAYTGGTDNHLSMQTHLFAGDTAAVVAIASKNGSDQVICNVRRADGVWISAGPNIFSVTRTRARVTIDAANEKIFVTAAGLSGDQVLRVESDLASSLSFGSETVVLDCDATFGNDCVTPQMPVSDTTGMLVMSSAGASAIWWDVLTISAPGGAQTVEVGLNSETDSAFAVAKLKRLLVGLSTETDSVLVATARKSAAVGLTSETDSVLAATRGKLRTVGLNEEADTALSLQAGQTVAVGLAAETDSAFSVSWLKAKLAGLAEETGSALAVAKYKVKAVGLAAGAETALAATRVRAYVVGLASTAASVFSVGRLKARIAGLVTEVDSVLQVTPPGPGPSGPSYVLKYPLVSNLVRALTQRVRGRTHKVFWDSN